MDIRDKFNGIIFRRNLIKLTLLLATYANTLYAVTFEQETSGFNRSSTTDAKEIEYLNYDSKINKDWSYYGKEEVKRYEIQQEYKVKSQDIFSLRQAKTAIINGDLELAYFFLSKVNSRRSDLTLVKQRYLSFIKFIEGDYKESYELISSNQYNIHQFYQQVCLLRIINLVALDDMPRFKDEMAACQNATIDYAPNNHFWLKQISNIKERNKDLLKGNLILKLRETLADNDYIKIWMKLALYINREDVIISKLASFPADAYKDKEIRELVGFAYYRLGEVEKASEFIEDIETPNADNIRGNINLSQNKLELAFGHFKLALKKKQNSQNALERGIPLAYLLGQWDDGLIMLKRSVKSEDERKKIALQTVLNIRKDDIDTSRKLLSVLEYKFNNQLPYELILMDTYVSLREGNQERLKNSAANGCDKDEGMHCWLYMKLLDWDNIGKTMKREEPTLTSEFSIDDLKTQKEIIPLDDIIMIDQKDIEELDGNEINLKY